MISSSAKTLQVCVQVLKIKAVKLPNLKYFAVTLKLSILKSTQKPITNLKHHIRNLQTL